MEILQKFKDWKSIRNEKAAINYTFAVQKFFKYCPKPLEDVEIDDIVKYQAHLKRTKAEATQAMEAQGLKAFFSFTAKRELTSFDPAEITIPRVEEKIPLYVVQSEFELLCDIAKYEDPRILLALRLLWFTGVRVSELCDLRVDQMDTKEAKARIQTRKAFIPKPIFWDEETNELLKGIIRHSKTEYLFASPKEGQISSRQVQRWITHLRNKAGITKHLTPHSFRHGATKQWLDNGIDLPAIQQMLGHRSLMSIEKYTKRLDSDMTEKGREAVRRRVAVVKYDIKRLLSS